MSDVSDILQDELEILLKEIIRQHEAAGQVASKKTRDSFKVEVSENRGKLLGASYAGVLEKGRKPGKVPNDFTNILLRWMSAKGIAPSDAKQAEVMANAIKWKIIKEGTSLYVGKETRKVRFTVLVDMCLRSIEERVTSSYILEFKENIFNTK
jgi:hypothetical protein